MTLLTPQQVADLLQISIRTVYDNAGRLGGFYPAGIRVLRFKEDTILERLERPQAKGLAVLVSIPGEGVRRGRPRKQEGGGLGKRKAAGRGCFFFDTDPDRHGLHRGKIYAKK